VGVKEITADVFKIFPNPAKGEITISICDMRYVMCDFEIYDVFGRKQKAEGGRLKAESEIVVNISHLPAGIYFVKIVTENGSVTKKVVVEK
jgi:hypothetical protein